MSRDFDNIIKEIAKSHRDINQFDDKISKDIKSIDKDVTLLKKDIAQIRVEVDNISNKIDLILEILNNFTLMVMEDDESESFLNEYDDEGDWVPDPPKEDWSDDDDN